LAEERVFIGSRRESSLLYLMIAQRISARAKFVEALGRFSSFEYLLRHWPACPSFNEMREQDLPPASFAPIRLAFSVSASACVNDQRRRKKVLQ
jgi:hypothetical protein